MLAVMRSIPLRVKLVAAVLALVTAALLVISASSAFFLRSYLIDQVDTDLRSTSAVAVATRSTLRAAARSSTSRATTSCVYADDRGRAVTRSTTPQPASRPTSCRPLPTDSRPTSAQHVNVPYDARAIETARPLAGARHDRKPDGRMLMVGRNLADVDHTVEPLLWIDVLAGGAVLIVLASAGAAIVRGQPQARCATIERTAGAIAAGDLSQRVPDPEPGVEEPKTELGRLSRALNAMLTQIETRVHRARRLGDGRPRRRVRRAGLGDAGPPLGGAHAPVRR